MCGIVGLLAKSERMRDQLGQMLTPMLIGMTQRGPDSAGFAVFSPPLPAACRLTLSSPPGFDWAALATELRAAVGPAVVQASGHERHGVVVCDGPPDAVLGWLASRRPEVSLMAKGRSMDIYKDVGLPEEVATRYGLAGMRGSHGLGHTRMATESGISLQHAHPFVAGDDFCLVHNGSLSNPFNIRRQLERQGIAFESDNDTEAAARYIQWRLAQGDDLNQSLEKVLEDVDGFYTLLMANGDGLALVRDTFACKPAVVAETDEYVAIASEYRSLKHLPGIQHAEIFEPAPEEVYVWKI